MALSKPLAINPLPWTISAGFGPPSEETTREALTDLSSTGFRALHTDVPATMTTASYRAMLDEFEFVPAPGYFAADFSDTKALPKTLEDAKSHARQLAELGVDTTFVAAMVSMARLARPAIGEGFSAEHTKRSADNLAIVADAALAEGVRFALHPHVAMTIETEQETRMILDETQGSALAFGPDTGHLYWTGTLAQHIIRDYADRVAAIHLKDVDLVAMQRASRFNDDYLTTMNARHIWTEPGRGAVNFPAIFDALPVDFDGWLIVEVDVPNIPDRVESARVSEQYISGLLNERKVAA